MCVQVHTHAHIPTPNKGVHFNGVVDKQRLFGEGGKTQVPMSHVVQFFQENGSLTRTARILTWHLTEGELASVHKCIFQKKTESLGFVIRVLSL